MAHVSESDSAGQLNSPLRCIVVTPEATALETTAEFIALPLLDGELGIAPGHSPMIGRLGFGELRVVQGKETRHYYLDGGFVQVADNLVSILSNRAVAVEKLDAAVVQDQLSAALARPANSPESLATRERMQLQARAQLRLLNKHSDTPVAGKHH